MRFSSIFFRTSLGLILLLPSTFAISETTTTAAKEGLWDIHTVIQGVEEGKNAKAALEKEIEATQKELMRRDDELKKLNQELMDQAAVLNDDAKSRKQAELQKKAIELRNLDMQFKMEMPRKQSEAADKIGLKALKIAEDLAKEKDLDRLYNTSSGAVTYVKNAVNYTNDIISIYNKQHGAGTSSLSQKEQNSAPKG